MSETSPRINQRPASSVPQALNTMRVVGQVVPTMETEDHPFQVGLDDGYNLRIGNDIIQALNAGVPVTLHLQPYGGDTTFAGNVVTNGLFTGSGGVDTTLGQFSTGLLSLNMRGNGQLSDGASDHTFTNTSYVASSGNIAELGISFSAPPSGSVYVFWGVKAETSAGSVPVHVSYQVYKGNTASDLIYDANDERSVEIATTNRSTGMWMSGVNNLETGQLYYIRLVHRIAGSATGIMWGRYVAAITRM